jgi:hypothetical protein
MRGERRRGGGRDREGEGRREREEQERRGRRAGKQKGRRGGERHPFKQEALSPSPAQKLPQPQGAQGLWVPLVVSH